MGLLKARYVTATLLLMLVSCPLVAISLGSAEITIQEAFGAILRLLGLLSNTSENQILNDKIVLELRLPRIIIAMLCGAGLAISGAVLQCVTRNPLADPYLFGISSGASLGAIMAITGGILFFSVPICAFLGSLTAVVVVMCMSRTAQTENLVLAGVATSFLLSSIANLILYFSDPSAIQAVLFWSLGSFSHVGLNDLLYPTIIVMVGCVIIIGCQRSLYSLMVGNESAHTQGIAVIPLRLSMLIITALITSSLVATCGGIGFVGLMVPHISRMLVGAAHPASLIISAMLGAVLMLVVDVITRVILPSQELPVGVMTAMLGSVFFIFLLFKRENGVAK
ncbi:FecCD family ABC transporter permease [Shewanella maritima]|uniref:FecCD family ABC transporter permease n=1 Tax=Shewanella maritima TaxID=2520507 RepID=UPI003736185B